MRARRMLAVPLLLLLVGCPNRAVVVNEPERPGAVLPAPAPARPAAAPAPASEAARAELEATRAEARRLAPEAGAERLLSFAHRHRGDASAATALHEAGNLLLAARRPERAAQAIGTLLAEHPLYPRADEARYTLALADVAMGRARDALQTIDSIYPRLPEGWRPQAAAQAAAAAEAAGAMPEAVRWLDEVAARGTGDARAQALTRAADAVDRLADADVARLRESLPADAPVQPALTMKAARIAMHLRDYPRAEQLAREVFMRWPSGPYARDAQGIAQRIAKLTFVRPNVVGVAVPLSGNYKRWGEAILEGVGVALDGAPGVRLVVRDTRGEPDGAAQALEALALEEGAIMVIGGVTNAEAERAATTAEELQLPFVSLSKQEGVTDAGPNVFQNMLTASAQARALVDFAMGRRGMKRFAVMYPQIPYGVELATAFRADVAARGGVMRAEEAYAADRTTFTPLVKDLVGKSHLEARTDFQQEAREIAEREKDPFRRRKAMEKARARLAPVMDFDAIFIPDFSRNVRLITPALAVEDVVTQTCMPEEIARLRRTMHRPDLRPVQLLGANGWGADPSLFDTSPGGAGRYVRCAIFVDGFYAGSARPATRAFVEAFARKYPGQTPTILEASAHDAARMARELILARKVQTRPAFRDALAAVKGFEGATGDITIGPKRTPEKELFFLTVDRDGLRELTREELAGPGAGGG
jgi:ABC-type branched-subunit amino acid transport system substrate-binding protein